MGTPKLSPPAIPWQPSDTVGRYTLLSRLAVGGMAEIWLARQAGPRGFEKVVVIKRIIDTYSSNPEFVEMFLDEARIAAQLSHPNIVQIFDLGEHAHAWYIAMEYLPGENLSMIARTCARLTLPLPVPLAVKVVAQACEALAHAHGKLGPTGQPLDIIHRDVSPQNVIVTYDGQVKLVDFGIAKAANKAGQTAGGQIKGKFAYMAPEQAHGENLDARADLFALGIILYELCTRSRLFKAADDVKVLTMVLAPEPVEPSRLRNPALSPELAAIIDQAVAKPVERRFQNARAFQAALEGWLTSQGPVPGSLELATMMKSLFADRIAAREKIIETASKGELTPSGAREALTDTGRSMPGGSFAAARRSKMPLVFGAIGVAAAALIGVAIWDSRTPYVPPAVEVQLTGSVSIDTEPKGALITLDGKPLGRSPLVKKGVALGTHELTAVLDGRETAKQTVTLAQADQQELAMLVLPEMKHETSSPPPNPLGPAPGPSLPPGQGPAPGRTAAARGKLTLNTTPWTRVTEKGRVFGETPLIEVPLPAGRHTLRLQNEQKKIDRSIEVEIKAGETTFEKLNL